MKSLFKLFILSCILFFSTHSFGSTSPLASFSNEWNQPKYFACNSAESVTYLTEEEKKIIYILNLVRINPSLFASTVVRQYPSAANKTYLLKNSYYLSLHKTLNNLAPIGVLAPDEKLFTSAECHAISSGKNGYVGHDRLTNNCRKNSSYFGECCDYGRDKALDIVMALLVDENVPSLGHRKICLDPSYKTLGTAIRPHKTYRINTVLDFGY